MQENAADPQINQPSGHKASKRWLWAALPVGGLVLYALVNAISQDDIKVSVGMRGVEVTNTGTTPVRILDVVINDRDDCSTIPMKSKTFSPEHLHKVWVANGSFMYVGEKDGKLYEMGSNRALSTEPRVLKPGATANWVAFCPGTNYIRARITTEAGTQTFRF